MQGKTAKCLLLGLLTLGLFAQPGSARSKTVRSAKKFTAARVVPVAAMPTPQTEVGKVILVLQTRDYRVTVRSSEGEQLRYSVATPHGIALADQLSVSDLKSRFPELHEIVMGTAWAGLDVQGFKLRKP